MDRDGVLNRTKVVDGIPKPPAIVKEVEILPGVSEAIQIIKNNNFVPIVVTNQPDVARGNATKFEVDEINAHVGMLLGIKHFFTCFHDDHARCWCRKPQPGLIEQAALELNLSLPSSFLVGDRWRDISAGQSAGCRTFFIDYSYPEKQPQKPFTRVSSLLEATILLVGGR